MRIVDNIKKRAKATKRHVRKLYARAWHHYYKIRYKCASLAFRHGHVVRAAFLTFLLSICLYLSDPLQDWIDPYFADPKRYETLWSLLANLGGALVAVAAISFSLIVFALQVNVERMPHGLFWRFSADKRIMASFVGTFIVAIGIAFSGTIQSRPHIGLTLMGVTWAIIFMFLLIVYAYRRALILINPIKQLSMVIDDANRDLRAWERSARRARPLLEEDDEEQEPTGITSSHDRPLTAYYQINHHWTQGAQRAIDHAVAFVKRYSSTGDYQVSGNALHVLVEVNGAYIQAKGKTFFANHAFIDNPFSTDGFINYSLEQLRQLVAISLSNKDEQLLEQVINSLSSLAVLYTYIDYSNPHASKTHANLAASYLSEAVTATLRHDMPDVAMQGVRAMGKVAINLIANSDVVDVVSTAKSISQIAVTGSVNQKTRAVTITAVEHLTNIIITLIKANKSDIRFVVSQVRECISMVAQVLLHVPDTPLSSVHSTYLAPYYSSTTNGSFRARLMEIVNALIQEEEQSDIGQGVCRNISCWARDSYREEKDLLILAIGKRSHFTFDILHFITGICELLLGCSEAISCPDHVKDDLQKEARRLLATLTWIPKDKETIQFLGTFNIHELVFECAINAHRRGHAEFSREASNVLFRWAFEAGAQETGWAMMETSLYGLCTLELLIEPEAEAVQLKEKIAAFLEAEKAPEQNLRDRTARDLRERAATLYRAGHWSSVIENVMAQCDQGALEALLVDVANILSPGTADEPVCPHLF